MKLTYLTVILFFFISFSLHAQIEKVIVEKYYISDSIDETDTTGSVLPAGSKTYRIYIDLMPGSKIKKIYGDVNHALKISSTATFFNNSVDGQSFAKDFSKNRYLENTVALDTWLTLGQTTKVAAKTHFGILKDQDADGSFIGGANNDGGSAVISTGLMINTDPLAGIPLTSADGMDTMMVVPTSWANYGIVDLISGIDSTIFGSVVIDSQFVSYDAGLQCSGAAGVIPDSNQVLVAQLTTTGDISFELNLEVEQFDGVNTTIVKYVANDSVLLSDELISPFLTYPPLCGCLDPNYLEYSSSYSCANNSLCNTLIVFGCMDTLACNYNSSANFNLQTVCCYIGYCNDLDITVVCPSLPVEESYNDITFEIYPNPTQSILALDVSSKIKSDTKYAIYDLYGRQIKTGEVPTDALYLIDVTDLANGLYLIRVSVDDIFSGKSFIKTN